ncbi:MAG: SRPBCC family protein [Ilumatobacteraceae bacterium]
MPTHPVQPPEWIDSAPIRVERTVDIAAPPSAVWAVITDHERWPEWFTAIESAEVTLGAEGVGGGRRVTVKKLPLEEQFTVWDEDEHFAFAVIGSKIPILDTLAESVRIEATEAGCRVNYRQGLQARRGFGKVLELMWKPAAKGLDEALVNLKVRVERA